MPFSVRCTSKIPSLTIFLLQRGIKTGADKVAFNNQMLSMMSQQSHSNFKQLHSGLIAGVLAHHAFQFSQEQRNQHILSKRHASQGIECMDGTNFFNPPLPALRGGFAAGTYTSYLNKN